MELQGINRTPGTRAKVHTNTRCARCKYWSRKSDFAGICERVGWSTDEHWWRYQTDSCDKWDAKEDAANR